MSLYFKWTINNFRPHNVKGAFEISRVVANPYNVSFSTKYVLGLGVLTRDLATAQMNYFDIDVRTFT